MTQLERQQVLLPFRIHGRARGSETRDRRANSTSAAHKSSSSKRETQLDNTISAQNESKKRRRRRRRRGRVDEVGEVEKTSTMMAQTRATIFALLLLAAISVCHGSTSSQQQSVPSQSNRQSGNGSQTFGDLVAIGAISLLEPSNRLVDELISSAHSPISTTKGQQASNKLDYIVDFMRANKLGKFCDLLTSNRAEIARLRQKLNDLSQFTLFVPTNEALLLMPSGLLEAIRENPPELEQFIMAHASKELVVPTLSLAGSPSRPMGASSSLIESLSGGQLRVSTVAANQRQSDRTGETTKLELIVNGANVLSGHSYALQEPNNSSATYAIVHLVERALYPAPNATLAEKMRLLAPSMGKLVEQAQDAQLNKLLASPDAINTLFLPNEDAFKATPSKLMEQLYSNRTKLTLFLRAHLLDGLYYGQQLASIGRLNSALSSQFEFESKTLQSRSLVLVNSIPILESDIMALNGVLHIISRPIFEQNVLENCNCNQAKAQAQNETNLSSEAAIYEKLWPQDQWRHNYELERDESQTDPQVDASLRLRSQRSSLVARNNRDFYRPSAAPANLLLQVEPASGRPAVLGQNLSAEQSGAFEVERYKVVLNASSRQRLRDQMRGSPSSPQFAYDSPMTGRPPAAGAATPTEQPGAARHAYSPAPSANTSGWLATTAADEAVAMTSRQQRVLKFQPEDARDPPAGSRLSNLTVSRANQQVGASESFSDLKRAQASGKTVAPPSGCAFYDADCRRFAGRLVRLPASRRKTATGSPGQNLALSSSNQSHQVHLDSTFGETTTQLPQHLNKIQLTNRLPARVSPLNQPLPPWNDEEHRLWRAQDASGDIARIQSARTAGLQFGSGLSREQSGAAGQATGKQAEASIILLPVKLVPASGNLSAPRHNVLFGGPHFHTPTPYSVSLVTTHTPTMFSPPLGRLTNFSAFEVEPQNQNQNPKQQQQQGKSLRAKLQQPIPRAPSAHRKQQLQQLQIDNNGSFGANFGFNPASGEKQARKIVRLSSQAPDGQQTISGGDMLITSARLSNRQTQASNLSLFEGLASHASNQSPDVSSNVVQSDQSNTDFFQNRTIAEIMEDSGLRIDGQQVTFGRLKECLAEADLLGLIGQTGNSLTIFMPTDSAFQRLVQQQALALQRDRPSRSAKESNQRLPLVARGGADLSAKLVVEQAEFSASSAADRLTLDCASNQVRQILLDHLSARLIMPKQLLQDTAIASLSGRQLLLSSVPSKKIVVVDGHPVIAATRAKNGMVYVLNKFLNLTQQVPNVLDLIQTQPNLTTFLSYLTFSNLADRLRRESGPLTILAPTNEAFEQLSSSARQLINSDPAALNDILRGHIVEGAQYGKLISMRNKLKTLNPNQHIEAKVIKPNVYLLDNQMTSMRLIGTTGNGVVNAIDRLIVPGWLKVPMTLKPERASTNLELESPLVRTSSANLNLPELGSQPTRFGQPLQTTANSQPNSFLLANNSSSNNLFDGPQPNLTTENTLAKSPFSRLANLTNNQRGAFDELQKDNSRNANGNISKNLQLIDKLASMMQARKFVKYLLRSRVSEALKPDMNYVILVPTDQAIEKLPKQIIDMLERDPERLADLVNYHVLDTTFEYINTIPDGQTLNTLNEKDILFNWHRNNTILTASGAVVMGGIQEENIALLIVDRVLYPTPGDILNIISKSPILSNFTSLIRNAGLEQQLSLAGPYTLFAPSDFAFNQLDKSDLDFLRRNKDSARRFLLRHLSQPAVFTSSIALSNSTSMPKSNLRQQQQVPTMSISNSLGEDLTLRQRNDYFSVNDVNFSYADVAATNGVVHVIDGLL